MSKISELTQRTALVDSDLLPVANSGSNFSVSVGQLRGDTDAKISVAVGAQGSELSAAIDAIERGADADFAALCSTLFADRTSGFYVKVRGSAEGIKSYGQTYYHDTWLWVANTGADECQIEHEDGGGNQNVIAVGFGKLQHNSYYQIFRDMQFKRCAAAEAGITQPVSLAATFLHCAKLKEIDVSGWDMSACTSIRQTFANCTALSYLDCSTWDTSQVKINAAGQDHMYGFVAWSGVRYIKLGAGFFNAGTLNGCTVDLWNNKLGFNADGTDNGWLAHLAEVAPNTGGRDANLRLYANLVNASWAAPYISTLGSKGWNIITSL